MRKTICEVNLTNLGNNIKKIISEHDYKYNFGVVKANCYGHGDIKCIETIINSGCNYLAVATIKEALNIRKYFNDIPILFLGCIFPEDINICILNNITVTISSLDQVRELIDFDISDLKVHIKLNTGMNRLGFSSKNDVLYVYNTLKDLCTIEGIYTHMYEASNIDIYTKQMSMFEDLCSVLSLDDLIVHTSASEALDLYPRSDIVNGCRIGIIMYGFGRRDLLSTFSVKSNVIQINELNKGDVVGYNGTYVASDDGERIAVIPIGYADGIIRKNKGRSVYINNREYFIVGNICMDMMFVKVDDDVSIHDIVYVLKDNKHIEEVSEYLETIPYEVMCTISERVERVYVL